MYMYMLSCMYYMYILLSVYRCDAARLVICRHAVPHVNRGCLVGITFAPSRAMQVLCTCICTCKWMCSIMQNMYTCMLHPADDGQQARNSCTGLRFFFSGVTHFLLSCTVRTCTCTCTFGPWYIHVHCIYYRVLSKV